MCLGWDDSEGPISLESFQYLPKTCNQRKSYDKIRHGNCLRLSLYTYKALLLPLTGSVLLFDSIIDLYRESLTMKSHGRRVVAGRQVCESRPPTGRVEYRVLSFIAKTQVNKLRCNTGGEGHAEVVASCATQWWKHFVRTLRRADHVSSDHLDWDDSRQTIRRGNPKPKYFFKSRETCCG